MTESASGTDPVIRYIAIQGNPTDGFTFYGPFLDHEEAETWMSDNDPDSAESWWITELVGPL